jgi:hypothetical protein
MHAVRIALASAVLSSNSSGNEKCPGEHPGLLHI